MGVACGGAAVGASLVVGPEAADGVVGFELVRVDADGEEVGELEENELGILLAAVGEEAANGVQVGVVGGEGVLDELGEAMLFFGRVVDDALMVVGGVSGVA